MTSVPIDMASLHPRGTRTRFPVSTLLATILAVAYLAGLGKFCGDLALACALAAIVGDLRRGVCVVAALALFFAAFPPFAIPGVYLVALTPLFYLWRHVPQRRWTLEAFVIGFAAAWLAAPYLGASVGANGRWIMVLACAVIGLQWLGLAAATRWTRDLSVGSAVLIVAAVGAALEYARTTWLDDPVLLLALPAAPTPLAQWAHHVTIFGVSALLYAIAFLLVPDMRRRRGRRWLPTIAAALLAAGAWFGGHLLRVYTPQPPLPFRALLIQPHAESNVAVNGEAGGLAMAKIADQLTTAALAQGAQPDLIIWPEGALGQSSIDEFTQPPASGEAVDLAALRNELLPRYGRPTLAGLTRVNAAGQRFNSAALVSPTAQTAIHDKLKLIILSETLPAWLPAHARRLICAYFQVAAPYSTGGSYQPLVWTRTDLPPLHLAISLCYEMHFPSLPQYQRALAADVVIHLTDESWFRGFRGHPQLGTWACQYRAIETRRWQLVCGNWAHSAVIDPYGNVRRLLANEAGVIDTAEWSAPLPTRGAS